MLGGRESVNISFGVLFDDCADNATSPTRKRGRPSLTRRAGVSLAAQLAIVAGKGQAWVDDFQFDVVGKDVATTQMRVPDQEYPEKVKTSKQAKPLNLDFEK